MRQETEVRFREINQQLAHHAAFVDEVRAHQIRAERTPQAPQAVPPHLLPPPLAPNADIKEPKVSEPKHFTGKKSEVEDFITQNLIVFKLNPSRFPDDVTKCYFISSYMRDTAFHWIQPYIGQFPAPEMLSHLPTFLHEFRKVFGDPDIQASSERQLVKLKQTGSASSYASEFLRVSTSLDWNDRALCFQFQNGLKDVV